MTLILIVLILLLVCGSGWGYSRYPSSGPYFGGGLGLVLVILLIWFLMGGRL